MSAMTKVSVLATEIPGAFLYVPEPSWRTIIIYYAVIVGGLSGRMFAPKLRIWSTAILILIGAIYFWHWEQWRKETELTILPLNGGHAVFVNAAGQNNNWLVDCGNKNAVEFTLKPFLQAQGVNKIQCLALTEGDARNIGGAQSLNELFGVGEIYTSPIHFRSSAYRKAVSGFDPSPARHKIIQRGDSIGCWQVLYPDANDNFPRADDKALVLLGNFHGTKILLLSDLGHEGQTTLLARTNDLHADIVIAGLPEEGEPLCDALFNAIQPNIIVIADSEFPVNRRANPILRERLEQKKVPVIYTGASGTVTIRVRPNGWELRAMDGKKFSPTSSSN
jgi:competence protein ComEC